MTILLLGNLVTMILLRNTQKVIPLVTNELQRDATLLLKAAGDWCLAFDVGITLLDDPQMKLLNKRYHKRNKTTDILSFPVYPVPLL